MFQWTLAQDNLPKTFYNEYFFRRLHLCGNHLNNTDIEEQKNCQTRLVDNILKNHEWFFDILTSEQKMSLGKALLEASKLFDLKSFKCLDEKIRSLLEQELDKLAQPPSEKEVSIRKPATEALPWGEFMSIDYAGHVRLAETA